MIDVLNKYQMAAIIGLYRMGNGVTLIASLIGCAPHQVTKTLISYFLPK